MFIERRSQLISQFYFLIEMETKRHTKSEYKDGLEKRTMGLQNHKIRYYDNVID